MRALADPAAARRYEAWRPDTAQVVRTALISLPLGLVVAVVVTVLTMTPDDPPDTVWRGDSSLLVDGDTNAQTGSRVTLTDSMRQFDRTVRINDQQTGLVVDRTELACHGGRARVSWHIGNLEPITRNTGIHLTARLDGLGIASIVRGSTVDVWGDHPLDLETVIACPAGNHVLDLRIDSIHGAWGFPYVMTEGSRSDNLRVGRGFIVQEVWN